LEGVRGQEKRPGEFRNDIVWIGSEGTSLGEARYIPPPASHVADLMGDLEKFANEELELPPLVQCALLHYQFEAIHPYFDGNGRTGRLLITLFLAWKRVLPKPLLYLSAYFERGRQMYYDQLFNVSRTGDWEAWLTYFFQGVTEQAYDAIDRIRRVRALQDDYRQALQARHETANALHLVDELFSTPFVQIGDAAQKLHVSHAGARGILERLKEMGIVEEVENQWPRLYVARKLLKVVEGGPNEGT
jgi:Fic family protein